MFPSETKEFVRFHFEANGCVRFHSAQRVREVSPIFFSYLLLILSIYYRLIPFLTETSALRLKVACNATLAVEATKCWCDLLHRVSYTFSFLVLYMLVSWAP